MLLKMGGFAALGIGLFVLTTYIAMRLWNWLVPSLFNGPRLRFVQALGLFFLIRLLFGFGGFGRSHYFGYRNYGRWHEQQHAGPDKHNATHQQTKLFKLPTQV